ncbi:MAG: hypothetical protein K0Q71_4662 [Thermomicrobiales bacterium]|nr:hypothetical protein [Thermomicrobiales bacterium]
MSDAMWTPPDAVGLSLTDAAVRLGISPDAAWKRLERGTLRGKKHQGRWVVYLDPDAAGSQGPDAVQDATWTPPDAGTDSDLVVALRDEIAFLRSELEARTEEIRRRDHIIAGLIERVPELPATTTAESTSRTQNLAPRSDVSPKTM